MSENLYSSDIQGDFNDPTIDSSGYGALSASEKNQTYFTYFSSVASTTPEIIDQTSYFIKYLIDAQGNVVTPQPNSIDLINMLQNFESGKLVNVSSLEGTTLFNTLLGTKRITNIGKIETLMTTETGSSKIAYVNTMSYASGPGSISEENAYNYSFKSVISQDKFSQDIIGTSGGTWFRFPFDVAPLNTGGNYSVSTYDYTFPNNTITQGTLVQFVGRLICHMGSSQIGQSNNVYIRITKQTNGTGPWEVIPLSNGNTYKVIPIQQGETKTISYTTPYMNFNVTDKVRLELKLDNGSFLARVRFQDDGLSTQTAFFNGQDYVALNQIYAPYWSIGTYTTSSNEFTMITASSGLTGMSQNQYSQIIPTASTAFGFNNIYLPFVPQPGDFIRFEYNPNKVHTIYENTLTTEGSMSLKIVPSVPTGSILDHFCIYRINPNAGNQIILNIQKPEGTTGQPLTGFIKPQHMTKELEDNFTTIIQKLAAEGLLT